MSEGLTCKWWSDSSELIGRVTFHASVYGLSADEVAEAEDTMQDALHQFVIENLSKSNTASVEMREVGA